MCFHLCIIRSSAHDEAENPDLAAGPVLEQIRVHGNIYPWWFFAGMWLRIFPSNAVSRTKVVHKISQKLCNPLWVTKRDMGYTGICWFWERAIAWPPLCWCRLMSEQEEHHCHGWRWPSSQSPIPEMLSQQWRQNQLKFPTWCCVSPWTPGYHHLGLCLSFEGMIQKTGVNLPKKSQGTLYPMA